MTHTELKKIHSNQISNFQGLFWAFNKDQFSEGLKKVGFEKGKDKIVDIGMGCGFVLKSKMKDFKLIIENQKKERLDFKKDRKNLLDALIYELINHEYGYTYDTDDALRALDLEKKDVDEKLLKEACEEVLKQFV